MPDTPRLAATSSDSPYSLSIEDAADLYAAAGHPRTLRTVQRYCASGHLECVKAATLLGDKYYVAPESVSRHIAQIEELVSLDSRTKSPGLPRPIRLTDAAKVTAWAVEWLPWGGVHTITGSETLNARSIPACPPPAGRPVVPSRIRLAP